jgi:class 3 adenylate cyclase
MPPILRTIVRDHGGNAIDGKLLGDGVLAVFTSERQAIEAARACASASGDLTLHLGIHAGDVSTRTTTSTAAR